MLRAAQLRSALELSLDRRVPSAFSPQAKTELPTISSGISEVDALLSGGLPVGAITEIVGTRSSGRLTCAQNFIAQVMQAGHVCAWVDTSDSFAPESAAGSGVDLARLLWIRCGEGAAAASPHSLPAGSAQEGSGTHPAGLSSTASAIAGQPLRSGGSPHPRHEVHGLSQAVDTLLSRKPLPRRRRQIGTPGVPNRSLESRERVEQVAYDRLPARRGSNLVSSAPSPRPATSPSAIARPRSSAPQLPRKPWSRLDQALRATDLLLQSGGFGALVLDLGHIDPQFATRIPLSTWFRFRAAAERTRTCFVLLSQHACAQSSAEIVLRTSLSLPPAGSVLTELPFSIERVRQRFTPAPTNVISMRRPSQRATSAHWTTPTTWAAGQ